MTRSSGEFVRTVRELGYIEGKKIRYELRSAEGNPERFPALADELVRLKVDLLFATSTAGGDPIEAGLVDSLARRGQNVTGVTLVSTELIGKRLELLKETIPGLTRAAVLWNPRSRNRSPLDRKLAPGTGIRSTTSLYGNKQC